MKRILVPLTLGLPISAHAVDGVIEINAAKVAAAGGYPYTISQPGSYRLTSGLVQPTANTHVLVITAADVTVDLNGFAITGPTTCSMPSSVTSCTGSGSGQGITSSANGVTIRNGTLRGIGETGIYLSGQGTRVEGVHVDQCGGVGIYTWTFGQIERSRVSLCASDGINGRNVLDSAAQQNGGVGILGVQVSRATATENASGGIVGATVSHSWSSANGGDGIKANLAVGNEASANAGNGITANQTANNTVEANQHDGVVALYAGTVVGNAIRANGGYGINTAGKNVVFTQNVIDGNIAGAVADRSGGGHLPHSLPANSNLCNGSAC